jgi:hypothetical protein
MLREELVGRRLFDELEGSMNKQVAPDRPIICAEQRIGGDADTPEETDVPKDVHELAQSANDHPVLAVTNGNAISGFRRFFACQQTIVLVMWNMFRQMFQQYVSSRIAAFMSCILADLVCTCREKWRT